MFAMITFPWLDDPVLAALIMLFCFALAIAGFRRAMRMGQGDEQPKMPDPSKAIKVPVGEGKTKISRKPVRWQDRVVREEELERGADGEIKPLYDPLYHAIQDAKRNAGDDW